MRRTDARELAFLLTFDGLFNPEFSADELYELALFAGSPSDDEGIRDVFTADSMAELMNSASELSKYYSDKELEAFPDGNVGELSLSPESKQVAEQLRAFAVNKNLVRYAIRLAKESDAHASETDAIINRFSPKRPSHRLSKVTLSILRCAICEINHFPEPLTAAIINDSVNLAKTYGDDNDYRFINGLLGSYVRSLPTEK